jgi:hypothetical protein
VETSGRLITCRVYVKSAIILKQVKKVSNKMSNYIYKDINLTTKERSITIGGQHRMILTTSKGIEVILTSNKSIKSDMVQKSIENNYEHIKQLI